MTLDEYSKIGDKHTFTYWLESRLDQLGSIWGGSSFKFGIFNRNEQTPKRKDTGACYSDKYAWNSKYGSNESQAFDQIRSIIIKVAESANRGDLKAIEEADLGHAYKWKIAFHYQSDIANPIIAHFFKRELLFNICPELNHKASTTLFQAKILEKRKVGEDVFSFCERIYNTPSIKYWLYAPGENANMWPTFYNNHVMGLGWDIGDLKQYKTASEIKEAIKKTYNKTNNPTNDTKANWEFCNEMNIGDIVIAKQGRNSILGWGVITSNNEFRDIIEGCNCSGYWAILNYLFSHNSSVQSFDIDIKNLKEDEQENLIQRFISDIKKDRVERTNNQIRPYLLIIDEINRGNISKIFGELITLLEADKRIGEENELTVTLPYSQETFGVPSNLYIIGTMNTADRSVGYIDYAIRRRFAFITLKADRNVIESYYTDNELKQKALAYFDQADALMKVSSEYEKDDLMIGHSYFLAKSEEELQNKMVYEVRPLLLEYFNDGLLAFRKDDEEYKAIKNFGEA